MGPSVLWKFIICVLLHSSLSLPADPRQHSELRQEIKNVKSKLEDLFERVNELSRSNKDDNNGDDDDMDGGIGDKERLQPHSGSGHICLSRECIATSHRIFEKMDLNSMSIFTFQDSRKVL